MLGTLAGKGRASADCSSLDLREEVSPAEQTAN